jgi:hypothetical protein
VYKECSNFDDYLPFFTALVDTSAKVVVYTDLGITEDFIIQSLKYTQKKSTPLEYRSVPELLGTL